MGGNMSVLRPLAMLAILCLAAAPLRAQTLTFATVERPPFSFRAENGTLEGFSIELMREIAHEMGLEVDFQVAQSFPAMLGAVESGKVDGAIANITMTAVREAVMDFSLPVFDGGVQIMVPRRPSASGSLLSALLRWQVAAAAAAAFGVLLAGGLLMWLFERGRDGYFNRPMREAMFPSFWWALNLIVNGGFEERIPQSRAGRVFAVLLVVSSLFVVSIFVGQITAAMTVQAINGNIQSVNDLAGRRVATTAGSTASDFLTARDIQHYALDDLAEVLAGFEAGNYDAVVFDGPVLSYYVRTHPETHAELIERVFRRESYGIALPQGSPLTEGINRALLRLRENGVYARLYGKWFGRQP
ncbi:MAG: glutamine ABC transporter substrate-binding protein [Alphaproteobacteria bacterium]|nr:MAG: glutamine ABC transporter substrate-binding protein [Alphaproteobacteria bacterium]